MLEFYHRLLRCLSTQYDRLKLSIPSPYEEINAYVLQTVLATPLYAMLYQTHTVAQVHVFVTSYLLRKIQDSAQKRVSRCYNIVSSVSCFVVVLVEVVVSAKFSNCRTDVEIKWEIIV